MHTVQRDMLAFGIEMPIEQALLHRSCEVEAAPGDWRCQASIFDCNSSRRSSNSEYSRRQSSDRAENPPRKRPLLHACAWDASWLTKSYKTLSTTRLFYAGRSLAFYFFLKLV